MDTSIEDMTYPELLAELRSTKIGSKKARRIHRALKKYGSGLDFWCRYPAAPFLAVMALLAALAALLLK